MSRRPTQFTRESAERIANVVRAIELTPRPARPLRFDREDDPPKSRVFRIARFSGDWPVGTDKVVTLKYLPSQTANVTNLFFPLEPGPGFAKDCAIAREGTSWFLIDVPFEKHTAIFVTETASPEFVTEVEFDPDACQLNVEKTTAIVIKSFETNTYLKFDT